MSKHMKRETGANCFTRRVHINDMGPSVPTGDHCPTKSLVERRDDQRGSRWGDFHRPADVMNIFHASAVKTRGRDKGLR